MHNREADRPLYVSRFPTPAYCGAGTGDWNNLISYQRPRLARLLSADCSFEQIPETFCYAEPEVPAMECSAQECGDQEASEGHSGVCKMLPVVVSSTMTIASQVQNKA